MKINILLALSLLLYSCTPSKVDNRDPKLRGLVNLIKSADSVYKSTSGNQFTQEKTEEEQSKLINDYIANHLNGQVDRWRGKIDDIENEATYVRFKVLFLLDLNEQSDYPEYNSIVFESYIGKGQKDLLNNFSKLNKGDSVVFNANFEKLNNGSYLYQDGTTIHKFVNPYFNVKTLSISKIDITK